MTHSIAIVGAGPAGCYTAQAMRKTLKDAEITVIDRLPVPYGLVRYGVAADHQGTKGITRQFARVFERQDVALLGNVELGRDLQLDDLRGMMDAVVLATGLYADRPLGVPGEDLKGVYGSGTVTRFWNAHPDEADLAPELGKKVVVVGNGNVAMDIVRILGKGEGDFDGSDIDLDQIKHEVSEIHVVGRSDLGSAKFDIAMVKELAGLGNLGCSIAPGDKFEDTPISQAVNEVIAGSSSEAPIQVVFHSSWSCDYVEGANGQVAALHLKRAGGEDTKILKCDSIVSAIGFRNSGSVDRDSFAQSATLVENGFIEDGLFATGWLRRGPNGTIPANRADALEVAVTVSQWLEGREPGNGEGRAALLAATKGTATSYEDWLAIDAHETKAAPDNRSRKKLRHLSDMMDIISNARGKT